MRQKFKHGMDIGGTNAPRMRAYRKSEAKRVCYWFGPSDYTGALKNDDPVDPSL